MRRRDLIRTLAVGLAAPTLDAGVPSSLRAAARAVHAHLRGMHQDPALLIFTEHQNAIVSSLAELIVPATDTPGAQAAQVNRFVDVVVAEWLDEAERAVFLNGLADVDARSVRAFGLPFLDLEDEQQAAVVAGLDAELAALREEGLPTDQHFFQQMKSLTLYGYYTSEVGATEELHEMIVPGRYDPCGPVRQGPGGGRG